MEDHVVVSCVPVDSNRNYTLSHRRGRELLQSWLYCLIFDIIESITITFGFVLQKVL
jgi:hypothetical protein